MNSRMIKAVFVLSLVSLTMSSHTVGSAPGEQPFVLDNFLKERVHFNDGQIRDVHRGKAVATILDAPTPAQVFVFGIVHIDAAPERYLELANDFDVLRKLPGYIAVRRFSAPPQFSDLREFTITAEDLKELKNCKPDDCDFQLPSEAIDRFHQSINWGAADALNQANRLSQEMALEALAAYQKGGNAALGVYRDKNNPTRVAETFQALLGRLQSVPVYLPEVSRFLLEYPNVNAPNSQSEFYWEKVDFGLKPTLRIVQQITYRGGAADHDYGIALKQIYASHYFQSALDLTVCRRDSQQASETGFYLITVKGSQQAGLSGLKGSLVRKVAVGKTRSSLETTLTAIKQKLEAAAGNPLASELLPKAARRSRSAGFGAW